MGKYNVIAVLGKVLYKGTIRVEHRKRFDAKYLYCRRPVVVFAACDAFGLGDGIFLCQFGLSRRDAF
jgi:hypothetical protein